MVRSLNHIAGMLAVLAGAAICASPAMAQVSVDVGVGSGGVSVGASAGGGAVDVPVDGSTPSPDASTVVPEAGLGEGTGPRPLDQNVALEAVASGRALPLAEILALARAETDAEIVDAQLITAEGFLLYELTVVEPNGDVSQLYFYARSGNRVRAN